MLKSYSTRGRLPEKEDEFDVTRNRRRSSSRKSQAPAEKQKSDGDVDSENLNKDEKEESFFDPYIRRNTLARMLFPPFYDRVVFDKKAYAKKEDILAESVEFSAMNEEMPISARAARDIVLYTNVMLRNFWDLGANVKIVIADDSYVVSTVFAAVGSDESILKYTGVTLNDGVQEISESYAKICGSSPPKVEDEDSQRAASVWIFNCNVGTVGASEKVSAFFKTIKGSDYPPGIGVFVMSGRSRSDRKRATQLLTVFTDKLLLMRADGQIATLVRSTSASSVVFYVLVRAKSNPNELQESFTAAKLDIAAGLYERRPPPNPTSRKVRGQPKPNLVVIDVFNPKPKAKPNQQSGKKKKNKPRQNNNNNNNNKQQPPTSNANPNSNPNQQQNGNSRSRSRRKKQNKKSF
jgi:hypothetical protein